MVYCQMTYQSFDVVVESQEGCPLTNPRLVESYGVVLICANAQKQIEFAVSIERTAIVASQYACVLSMPAVGSLNHETTFIQVKDVASVDTHHTVREVMFPIHLSLVQVDW